MINKAELQDFINKSKTYNLIPTFREIRADLDTPLSIYLKLSKNRYSFLLESITGGENLARYSIIGTNPKKIIKTGEKEELGNIDPLKIIKDEINSYKVPEIEGGSVPQGVGQTGIPPPVQNRSGVAPPEPAGGGCVATVGRRCCPCRCAGEG